MLIEYPDEVTLKIKGGIGNEIALFCNRLHRIKGTTTEYYMGLYSIWGYTMHGN